MSDIGSSRTENPQRMVPRLKTVIHWLCAKALALSRIFPVRFRPIFDIVGYPAQVAASIGPYRQL